MQLRRDRLAIAATALLLVGLIVGFWIFRIALAGSRFPGWGDPLTYYYPNYMATGAVLAQGLVTTVGTEQPASQTRVCPSTNDKLASS